MESPPCRTGRSAVNESQVTALPLVAHVVYRFDYGGLENGIVNLINATQGQFYRHCVIALTGATDFQDRLQVGNVSVYELGKKPGKDFAAYFRFYRLLRKLCPLILHTRNVGTLDCAVLARLAGVSICIHGEHGWDVYDPDGTKAKYRYLRRLANPFVRKFVTVSANLNHWLIESVGIPSNKVTRICNGVDIERFVVRNEAPRHHDVATRFPGECILVGSVLRFQEIKDPMNLIEAFIIAHRRGAESSIQLGLVMIGDGPLLKEAIYALEDAGLANIAWLPGSRDDVPVLMRSFDLFVLGSRREGISNTLLEAMASGLPVIATRTGGNIELVRAGVTGELVEPEDPEALADEILRYARDERLRSTNGASARQVVAAEYSLGKMIDAYRRLYSDALANRLGQ